jgi:hypothetical protein
VSKPEYKQLLSGADDGHGFGFVNPGQDQASNGSASYYAFTARGIRFISMDTVAEGGGANGNLDNPQYEWLEDELDRSSSVEYNANGKLVHDDDPNRLIIVYGHHTLATMDNPVADEEAGPCTDPPLPGCDLDPRDSQPMHLGVSGPESLKALLFRYPNVIAAVTGHTHHNAIKAYSKRNPGRGFWEINTSSHVDFPQQSRLLEIMDNRDGTLSIFGTMVDQAAPAKAPPSGASAAGMSERQLASISRQLAANDPQRVSVTINGGTGRKRDRNAEMIIRDPRRLAER